MFYSEPNGTIRNTCLLLTLTQHFLHKAELSNKPPRIYCLWRKQFLAFDGGQNENDEWLWQFDFWISTFLTVMMLKFKCKSPREVERGAQTSRLPRAWCVTRSLLSGHKTRSLSVVTSSNPCPVTPIRIRDTDTLKHSLILDFACELPFVCLCEVSGWGRMSMKVNLLSRLRRSLMSLHRCCQDASCDH